MSHVNVDDKESLNLMKNIEKEQSLFVPFRSFEIYEYSELGNKKKSCLEFEKRFKIRAVEICNNKFAEKRKRLQ